MNMEKIKVNEVYVVNQPKHAIMTFAFIDPKKDLMEGCHELLLKLSENTDIMFIFKSVDGINPDAFAKVYGACAWIISDKILAKTYIKAISYAIIIFKDLVGFLTLDNCSGFNNYGDKAYFDMTLLKEIAASALSYPIFEATHLNSSEMYEIYKTGGNGSNKKFPNFPWSREEKRREYTTWKMTSRTAFFRPSLFEKLSTLSEDYIESFTWDNIKYFLASACEYLGVKRINHEIFELNVNRLSDYVDSAGKK